MPVTNVKRSNSCLPALSALRRCQTRLGTRRDHWTSPLSPSTPELFARKIGARYCRVRPASRGHHCRVLPSLCGGGRNPEPTVLDMGGTSSRREGVLMMRERPRTLPHDVGHSSDNHPSHRFQRRLCGNEKPGTHCLGHWRTARLITRSRTPGQTTSSECHRSREH